MSRRILGALWVLTILVLPLHAQTPSGEISGVVTDVERIGAAWRQSHRHQRRDQRGPRGDHQRVGRCIIVPALQPGIYTLKAERQGFRAVERANIEVLVGSANRIPVTLDVGQLTDVVEVTGGTPMLQTESAAIGTVIENRAIVELPLNGRNYLQLASLTPGATTNGPSSSQGRQRMGGQRNSFALNVGGQRVHYNHYSLDGVENTDLNFNSYMLLPSVDALQEFKVEAGLFDAEYGRAIAQINASTKVGHEQVSRERLSVRARFGARRQELLRSRGPCHSSLYPEAVRAHGRRPGGHAGARGRPEQAVLHVQLGGAPRAQVADGVTLAAAVRLAQRRLLAAARRQPAISSRSTIRRRASSTPRAT